MKNRKNKYGNFGWEEFLNNRNELLKEYLTSKKKNKNRPIQVSHGNAGEAVIRKWLASFLPKKFGVTSGYIIPNLICNNYKLLHYDVIIYDSHNSPILWVDGNSDNSEQGKVKAIPAMYVYSVLEVKATFSNKSVKETIKKIKELNSLQDYLPNTFTSGMIFFEIKNGILKKTNILNNFFDKNLFRFWGGVILQSELNPEMTGLLQVTSDSDTSKNENLNLPLAKDIDSLNIFYNEEGNIAIAEQGAGITAFFKKDDNKIHYSKIYSSSVRKNGISISLQWSYNHFSRFIISLLNSLEGKTLNSKETTYFGQVFDIIERNNN